MDDEVIVVPYEYIEKAIQQSQNRSVFVGLQGSEWVISEFEFDGAIEIRSGEVVSHEIFVTV